LTAFEVFCSEGNEFIEDAMIDEQLIRRLRLMIWIVENILVSKISLRCIVCSDMIDPEFVEIFHIGLGIYSSSYNEF